MATRAISMRCDMGNMLRQAQAAIDPKRDQYGAASAGVEQLREHIEMLREGKASLDEFADFYLLRPARDALWCCHVIGPDELYPAPDRETALRWAIAMNRLICSKEPHEYDPLCLAQVERWPYSAESHADGLDHAIEQMTPRSPAAA